MERGIQIEGEGASPCTANRAAAVIHRIVEKTLLQDSGCAGIELPSLWLSLGQGW
jgi:hypothetical protein